MEQLLRDFFQSFLSEIALLPFLKYVTTRINKQAKKMQSFFLNTQQDKRKTSNPRLVDLEKGSMKRVQCWNQRNFSLPSPPTHTNSLNNTKKHCITPNNQCSTLLAFSMQIFNFFLFMPSFSVLFQQNNRCYCHCDNQLSISFSCTY